MLVEKSRKVAPRIFFQKKIIRDFCKTTARSVPLSPEEKSPIRSGVNEISSFEQTDAQTYTDTDKR